MTKEKAAHNYREFMKRGYLISDFSNWVNLRDQHEVWDLLSIPKDTELVRELLSLNATETR